MARLLTQFFFIPSPPITESNCPDQTKRVFIITGGYAGLGFELSQILFAHNAIVYVAGRSPSKGSSAIERIKRSCPSSLGRIEFLNIDLADLKTVKLAAEAFLAREQRLDVLVNNAAVMYTPSSSLDAQGNDLQISTNCLGPYLLTRLLSPILAQTASTSPTGTVRVIWAGSVAIEVQGPKPDGMELSSNGGAPLDKGPQLNYGQSKVGNLFLARRFARETPESGVVHVCFNPGNLQTELQRHWGGLGPLIARILILHPAIKGAYTELFSALSPEITPDRSGSYVVPWGKIGTFRPGLETAMKRPEEGGTGVAEKFITWCDGRIAAFL